MRENSVGDVEFGDVEFGEKCDLKTEQKPTTSMASSHALYIAAQLNTVCASKLDGESKSIYPGD